MCVLNRIFGPYIIIIVFIMIKSVHKLDLQKLNKVTNIYCPPKVIN